MKKFFSISSSSGNQKCQKYLPDKGVPECMGKTSSVVHRGNLSWELDDFGSLLQAETKQLHPSYTSSRLVMPTERRLAIAFTVFPKGISSESGDHVGFRLQVLSVPKEELGALLNYRLLMLNGKSKILTSVEGSKEFKAEDVVHFEKLISIESLLGAGKAASGGGGGGNEATLLPDSKVIFVCEITARTSFEESTFTRVKLDFDAARQSGHCQLSKDLSRLLCDSDGRYPGDIRLQVANSNLNEKDDFITFPVHSLILEVRAPGLMAALRKKKEFIAEGRATLAPSEVKSEVFQLLLCFIYTGSVCSKKDLADFELLALAYKYKITELANLCEQALAESLEVHSVADVLRQAETLDSCCAGSAQLLKGNCLDFIRHNYDTVRKSKGWKQLTAECPSLAVKMNVMSNTAGAAAFSK